MDTNKLGQRIVLVFLLIFVLITVFCLPLLLPVYLLLPILYLLSSKCQYVLRMAAYACAMLISSTLWFFLELPTYGDVKNFKIIQPIFLFLTRFLNIKWEVRGAKYLQSDTPFVVVCNHQSSLDMIGAMEVWPDRCTIMAKSSVKYFGLTGLAAIGSGIILVERSHDKNNAVEIAANVVEQIKTKNAKVWIFPEGTRHHEVGLLPFKKGAFHIAVQAQVPIVPVVFSSYHFFYSKPEKKFLSKGFVIIQALPPIPTKGLKSEHVNDLSGHIRERMVKVYDEISAEAESRFSTSQY